MTGNGATVIANITDSERCQDYDIHTFGLSHAAFQALGLNDTQAATAATGIDVLVLYHILQPNLAA